MQLDIQDILRQLPHRHPFLLVDRVLEWRSGESIRALKNVTYDEPFVQSHFPDRPVMPGVLIIEALAQTAGVLTLLSANVVRDAETRFYFVGIDHARFRIPVEPGDQLVLTARLERYLKGIWRFSTAAQRGSARAHHGRAGGRQVIDRCCCRTYRGVGRVVLVDASLGVFCAARATRTRTAGRKMGLEDRRGFAS